MSMMSKKSLMVAVLVGTASPVLASDASDDARAARRAAESATNRTRSADATPGNTPRTSEPGQPQHFTAANGDCRCRCVPADHTGHAPSPDRVPDYGG